MVSWEKMAIYMIFEGGKTSRAERMESRIPFDEPRNSLDTCTIIAIREASVERSRKFILYNSTSLKAQSAPKFVMKFFFI